MNPLNHFSFMSVLLGTALCSAEPAHSIPIHKLGAEAGTTCNSEGLAVISTPDGADLRCDFQRLRGRATREGLWLESSLGEIQNTAFQIIASGIGRSEVRDLDEKGSIELTPSLVCFSRPGLTEEYSVTMEGVRQDFVVHSKPLGEGPLRVVLAVHGATASTSDSGATLVIGSSGRKISYSRLHVTDAAGKELRSYMEVLAADRLAIVVEDGEASYPVRVDPTFTDADWKALGNGLSNAVNAIAVDSSRNTYAGGSFTSAGGVSANRVAKWSGSGWSALGTGVNGDVAALAFDGSGNLYAGGSFTTAGGIAANGVAKWNGTAWSSLGSGLDGTVTSLAIDSVGNLYAGGGFTIAGGISANCVARWDGVAWSSLGSGLNSQASSLVIDTTGNLYVGGAFTLAGGNPANGVAKWNGSAWSALGSGINGSVDVMALNSNGNLYVGGIFSKAGGLTALRLAKWTGSAWSAAVPFTVDAYPRALAFDSLGDLYIGGYYPSTGSGPTCYLIRTNGSVLSLLGSGVGTYGNVAALYHDKAGSLIVGGNFATAGNKSANNIARAEVDGMPEIGMSYQNGMQLAAGSSTVSFGSLPTGTGSTQIEFTISNTGIRSLTGLAATIDGSGAANFQVTAAPPLEVAAGVTANFRVNFTPTTSISYSAVLHIASNDADENPFNITLTGNGTVPSPEISIEAGVAIADGGSRDYGSVTLGGSSSTAFTIRNTGNVPLTGISASIDGLDATQFAISGSSASSVAAGGTTTVNVNFAPKSSGVKTATLHISSNDADENPYDIGITGTGVAPDIGVEQPAGTSITDGGSKDFGNVVGGSQSELTFTVSNTGIGTLGSLALTKDGANASDFIITANPGTPVAAGASTTFKVKFAPMTFGPKSAALHLTSNDPDESPYDISLTGTGIAPEIAVLADIPGSGGQSLELVDGSSGTSEIGFGNLALSDSSIRTFTIKNQGNADLTGLTITKSGHISDFNITNAPASPVSGPSGTTTFAVRFQPTALGARSAVIRIASNDPDENPFDITLFGSGVAPEISIQQPSGANLADGGSFSAGNIALGAFSDFTFTVKNTGTGELTGLTTTIDGVHSKDFNVVTSPVALVSGPSGTTNFTVRFRPSGTGTRTATFHLASNDADESPYDITLTGTSTLWAAFELKDGFKVMPPSYVNVIFQLKDSSGKGINLPKEILDRSNQIFEVKEDGAKLSPSETYAQVSKLDEVPSKVRTILLIDTSNSVGGNLSSIKAAAKSLVDTMFEKQEIAIYTFNSSYTMIRDFTPKSDFNQQDLKSAIDGIILGSNSTNLFGSTLAMLDLPKWKESFTKDGVETGFLVVLTDGTDNTGQGSLFQVVTKRNNSKKKIFTIGFGRDMNDPVNPGELDVATLTSMQNAGYKSAADASELAAAFTQIQQSILDTANSFYWLNYLSPKRPPPAPSGPNTHTLTVGLTSNQNGGSDSTLAYSFTDAGFADTSSSLTINRTAKDPSGVESLAVPKNSISVARAITMLPSFGTPSYVWSVSNTALATLTTLEPDGSRVAINALGTDGAITLTVTDVTNSNLLPKTIPLVIGAGSLSTQNIIFAALPNRASSSPSFTLSASATSGLPVSFSLVSGPASISGSTITLNGGTGTVVIRASQAGNASYSAATPVDQSFEVTVPSGTAQSITFAALGDRTTTSAPFTLSATATSGLPVSFSVISGPASISGSTITITGGTGTVVVRASQAGNASYAAATPVDRSFVVTVPTGTAQSITFAALGDRTTTSAPFTLSATATSGLPVSFSLVSGPASISGSTITLTGGTGDVVIRASQNGNATYAAATPVERSFNVAELTTQTPVITSSPFVTAASGSAFSHTFTATNGPNTFALQSGTLPPGLALNANTGVLSGTVATPGTYSFVVKATNSNGTASFTQTLTFSNGTPAYAPDALAAGMVINYDGQVEDSIFGTYGESETIRVSSTTAFEGGTYTYAKTGPSAGRITYQTKQPVDGIIETENGVLQIVFTSANSGTFSNSGSYNTLDDNGDPTLATFTSQGTFTYEGPTNPVISTPGLLPASTAGSAYSQTLAVTSGTAPYKWTVGSGALPTGLKLNSTGSITGTAKTGGLFGFTLKVTDKNKRVSSKAFSLVVNAPPIISTKAALAMGTAGSAYSQTLVATSGLEPYTWSVTGGALPAGLALATDGRITGTPVEQASASFTIRVTGANGLSASRTFSLITNAPPLITTPATLSAGVIGVSYSQAITATGGAPTYTWAVSSGALPGGLKLGKTGIITGTPSTNGTSSFTVKVTGKNKLFATRTFQITIGAAAIIPPQQVAAAPSSARSLPIAPAKSGETTQTPRSPRLNRRTLSAVGTRDWTKVDLGVSYVSPVVIATPVHLAGMPPLVARLRKVAGSTFEIRMERTDGGVDDVACDVAIVAVEEGIYTLAEHGVTMEAARFESTQTAHSRNWIAEQRLYHQNYTSPVVLGQVMSANDPKWSVFWCQGKTRADAPDASDLWLGKTVGEDPVIERADETIGYMVIESGAGMVDGVEIQAGLTKPTVVGAEALPKIGSILPASSFPPSGGAISLAGMKEADGGWAVLAGPWSESGTPAAAMEDKLTDLECEHVAERAAYLLIK